MGKSRSSTSWAEYNKQIQTLVVEEQLAAAHDLALEAQAWLEQRHGQYYPDVIDVLILLANLEARLEHYPDAIRYLVDARARLNAAFDQLHPLYARLFTEWARIYMAQQLFREAQAFYAQACDVIQSEQGLSSSDYVRAKLGMGDAQSAQGKYDEARNTFSHALTIISEGADIDPGERVRVTAKLGLLNFDQNKFEQSLSFLEEAAFSIEQHLPDERSLLITVLEALPVACDHLSRNNDAQHYRKRLAELRRTDCRENSPELLSLLNELIFLSEEEGDFNSAESFYREAVDLTEKLEGTESFKLAEVKESQGEFYCVRGQYELARDCLQAALDIYAGITAADDPLRANVLHNMGTASLALGNYEEAESNLEESLTLRRKAHGDKHELVTHTLVALATLKKIQDKKEDALSYLSEAIESAGASGDESTVLSRAKELRDQLEGRSTITGTTATEIREIKELELPDIGAVDVKADDIKTVGMRFSHALFCMTREKHAEAARTFEEIIVIIESAHGSRHPDLVPILDNIAQAYAKLGLSDKAQAASSRAEAIRA